MGRYRVLSWVRIILFGLFGLFGLFVQVATAMPANAANRSGLAAIGADGRISAGEYVELRISHRYWSERSIGVA